jgi:hypothetical protein
MPKCCAEHQILNDFQRFSPTFQKLFLKGDFFDSFNGLRHRPRGGSEWGTGTSAGVDSAWEQNAKRIEASSSAYHPGARAGRFVGQFL